MKTDFKSRLTFTPQNLFKPGLQPPRRKTFAQPQFVGLVILAVIGTAATLWAFGYLNVPFLNSKAWAQRGKVPVAISYRTIPAYAKVTRDHLDFMYFEPGNVPGAALRDLKSIIGRVVDHEKPAGYVFTESDFAPAGTRDGLVAGIPAGKRAFTLSADKVKGLYGLQAGDRLDIVGTVRLDKSNRGAVSVAGGAGFMADAQTLAQDAAVVVPLRTRQVPVTSNSLTRGSVTRTRPVQESVIAVSPDEVQALAQALAMDADILIVPRSGQPEPEFNPGEDGEGYEENDEAHARNSLNRGYGMIETIKGSKRQRVMVPASQ